MFRLTVRQLKAWLVTYRRTVLCMQIISLAFGRFFLLFLHMEVNIILNTILVRSLSIFVEPKKTNALNTQILNSLVIILVSVSGLNTSDILLQDKWRMMSIFIGNAARCMHKQTFSCTCLVHVQMGERCRVCVHVQKAFVVNDIGKSRNSFVIFSNQWRNSQRIRNKQLYLVHAAPHMVRAVVGSQSIPVPQTAVDCPGRTRQPSECVSTDDQPHLSWFGLIFSCLEVTLRYFSDVWVLFVWPN